MSSLDYLDLCRLCLVKDRVSVPIFEGEGDVRQIFLKITACLPVKVDREDKLPKKICDDCVYKVELFYQFWNTTVNAEKQLLQWLGEVGLEDKPDYVTNVLNQNVMKPDQSGGNRLDGSMMQQVSGHQNNMGMGMMDNIGLGMPMMMPATNQQQMTSVPMDTSGSSVQNVQEIPGTSNQSTHEQITQSQTNTSNQQEEEEESSEEEENSEDECDGEEGLPVKEESEEDPNNGRAIEPTTFVNVSLACDEAGPSGLQQQKIAEMPEMAMPQNTDGDPKSGLKQEDEEIARKQVKRKITIDVSTKGVLKRSTKKRRTEDTNKKKEEISCDVCKTTFNMTRTEFRQHMLNHGKLYTFQCDVCSKKFKYKHNMQRHKIKVHGEATIYACRYCDFATIHCSYLKVHVTRKHTNDFRYCCDKCDRKFRIKADYTKHSMSHVNETCICDICGTSLSNKLSLYFHKNYKHKLRDSSYQCPVCKKKLQSQKNLSIHLRQHERRYACEECGMELTRKTALKRHIKTHSGEKPYPCHICDKSFVSTTVRKNHFLTHSGVRPYVCTICKQSFVQRPALSVHWKKKHPECSKAPPSVSIKDIIKTVTGNTTIKNV